MALFGFPKLVAASASTLFLISFTLGLVCLSGGHVVPNLTTFGACTIQKIGSSALLCVCVSSARIFYFTGALPHVFDQPPIAAGAGPFDLRWGGGGLFVAAATLMKDAG